MVKDRKEFNKCIIKEKLLKAEEVHPKTLILKKKVLLEF
jgi:hypothetical protein